MDQSKPTFKQYLEGKEQLIRAIELTPSTIVEYDVVKYCSISLGETKDEGVIVGLKPKQKIIIKWLYEQATNPMPCYVKFVGVNDVDDCEEFQTNWTTQKLQRWLTRYTTGGRSVL